MIDILLNALIVLGIVVTILLTALVLIAGVTFIVAVFGKIIDIIKEGKKDGGR